MSTQDASSIRGDVHNAAADPPDALMQRLRRVGDSRGNERSSPVPGVMPRYLSYRISDAGRIVTIDLNTSGTVDMEVHEPRGYHPRSEVDNPLSVRRLAVADSSDRGSTDLQPAWCQHVVRREQSLGPQRDRRNRQPAHPGATAIEASAPRASSCSTLAARPFSVATRKGWRPHSESTASIGVPPFTRASITASRW